MSSQSLSRRERRKRETRDRIREAAVDLFIEQGYESTKISEICERADVARQTFFNHFPAKRDVLVALFDIGLEMMAATLDSVCERGATTRERLRLFYGELLEPAVGLGPFGRDIVYHVVNSTDDAERHDLAGHVSSSFLELVRRGVILGDVTRRYDAETLAQLVEGGLVTVIRDWTTRGGFDPMERVGQLADLTADAIERRPDER